MRQFAEKALLFLTAVAALLLAIHPSLMAQQPARAAAPRLVVFLMVDQFPTEYIELYSSQWTRGLRRLLDEGAVFTRAAFPYGATATCAGHVTVATGAFPMRHGMVGNAWYDRDLDKSVTCEEDPDVAPVMFGPGTTTNRHSAKSMRIPNFADELRRQAARQPNVVSVAEKARSAIGLGGRGGPGTVVAWRATGALWSSSTAYTAEPWPDVVDFMRRNPISGSYGEVWTRLLPERAYRFVDDDPSEPTPAPWGRTFPHTLHSPNGPDDSAYITAWQRSPWSDEFTTDLAIHLAGTRRLGREPGTDMLALSLSSLDAVGHQYGPRSHEVQDVLVRADRAIGRLLDALDHNVGAGNYVLAMSADHGVARLPEQIVAEGGSAGRLGPLSGVSEQLLQWTLGSGKHVGTADGSQLSLTRATMAKLQTRPEVAAMLLDVLKAAPGVTKVFTRAELAGTDATADADLRAWRLSYMPDRSGDFVLVMKEDWVYGSSGTNHGTQNSYDQRVPLMLFGAGVRKGTYQTAATPADLAPTLASLAGISLPQAQGRVLTEALNR